MKPRVKLKRKLKPTPMTAIRKIYSFLGLPASGKDTQADLFAKSHKLKRIGIGDLIREEIERADKSDPFFAEIKKRYSKGIPQEDEVIFDLLKSELKKSKGGIVFDNFPFSLKQARYLDQFRLKNGWPAPIFIYLKIDPETAVKRIIMRRICSVCGNIYIDGESAICEKCGGALISRPDDREDVVRRRIAYYLPQIEAIKRHYENFVEVNGELSIEEVKKEVEKAIEKYG